MNEVLRDLRKIIIDHVRDPFHVNPAGCDISRHQDPILSLLESTQRLVALVLAAVTVDGSGLYAFLREFASAIDDARVDLSIKSAIVVTSASEKFFSAGADVGAFAAGSPRSRFMTALMAHEAFRKMENTPLVFIAAIAGHCLGGGLELALACDLRFAAEGSYQIGLPEVNLGLFPGSGGTQRLPRLVGLSRGLDMIANAKTFKPAEAKEVGIVDQLFPDAAACRAGAIEYAARLAAGPGVAIGHAKLAITQGYGAPLDMGLAIEREAIGRVFVSDDAEEGIKAFQEKRKPEFKSR